MEKSNPQVSYFTSTTSPRFNIASAPEGKQWIHFAFKNSSLLDIFKCIGNGYWNDLIQAIKNRPGGYDANKKKLPCITPSGTFRIRNDWDLLQYSQVVHLDYDDVDPVQLKERFSKSPYTLAAFVSPGGSGLKVFLRVNSGPDDHVKAFTQVRKVFDELAGVTSDPTARNISRLCYVSVDMEIYINPDAEVFRVDPRAQTRTVVPDPSTLSGNSDTLFTWMFDLTKKGKFQGEMFPEGYSRDSRNNFIFLFCCNCNRYGLSSLAAMEYARMIWVANNDGFTINELSRTVESAYSHTSEHGSFRIPKHLQA